MIDKFIIDKFHEKLFKDYKELDKRFIDREELKEKITELKVKSKDFECCLEILNELEKILELLK